MLVLQVTQRRYGNGAGAAKGCTHDGYDRGTATLATPRSLRLIGRVTSGSGADHGVSEAARDAIRVYVLR